MRRFYYEGMAFLVPDSVYVPREDSLLMARALDGVSGTMLDMGCGSGFLSVLAARRGATVTACDINPAAVEATLQNAQAHHVVVRAFQSDLFSVVKGTFDLIISNPPYLPDDGEPRDDEERQWHGGRNGREFIDAFIRNAGTFLVPHGRVLLLISSLNDENVILDTFARHGFAARAVMREKVPWEELVVLGAEKQ